ncbi:hypothetical protein D3C71_1388920 [compost metagenome]
MRKADTADFDIVHWIVGRSSNCNQIFQLWCYKFQLIGVFTFRWHVIQRRCPLIQIPFLFSVKFFNYILDIAVSFMHWAWPVILLSAFQCYL